MRCKSSATSYFIFFLLLFFAGSLLAQQKKSTRVKVYKRQLISAQTGLPLPFVSIALMGSSRIFVSDIAGFFLFSVEQNTDTIMFNRLSISPKKMSKASVLDSPIIELDEVQYNLADINVYPTSEAAIIMAKVKERLSVNNPDQVTPYSCYIYHKMFFDIDTAKISKVHRTKVDKDILTYSQNNHLILIESLTERKHTLPDQYRERVITGRVSGFKQPSLEYIPSQIQPFIFYKKYISLLTTDYLNPISTLGLKMYQFRLTDTTYTTEGDTVYHIVYSPKNKLTFKGLSGRFEIIGGSFAILKVEANGFAQESNNGIHIIQSYKKEGNSFWFPSLLEARIELGKVTYRSGQAIPLVGFSKSYLTSVNLNPVFNKEDFSNLSLEQSSYLDPNDTLKLEDFRPVALSRADSMAYTIIDSIGLAKQFDRLTTWGRSLSQGFIPAGKLKIDYTKIVDFNKREGVTLGVGVYTSRQLSTRYSVGGYFRHGFHDRSNKWGSSLEYYLWRAHDSRLTLSYRDDVIAMNDFRFLDGYILGSSEAFKRFSSSQMDLYKQFAAELESRFARDFKANIYWHTQRSLATRSIFIDDPLLMTNAVKTIRFNEFGAQLRWVFREKFIDTPFGKSPIPSFMPYVWLNYAYLKGVLSGRDFAAHRFEVQLEKSFRTSGAMVTAVRLTGGRIVGSLPNVLYYSAFGTYGRFSLEVPYTLGTMRPNEFEASEFVVAFVRHKIPLFVNSSQKFKPILSFNSSAGWGGVKGSAGQGFENGFYESGILFDNLFKILFLKYGTSVYYRYGPYHLPREIDNWAFKLSIEFTFGN